jgi:hypothetical protein
MDEKQIRSNLGDSIAHLKERLSYTRPRVLAIERCLEIERKMNELLVLLPSDGENVNYEIN